MHLFYTPDITNDETYSLSEEESKHCFRVLRLQVNDEINLIDGKGGFYTARIQDAGPKKVIVRITDYKPEFGKRGHYLHIAIAPTKNIDRMEWFLEKATEIGIDEITPIICEHSERRELRTDRLNKVITSAVKQSVKAYHPQLNEAIKFKDLVMKENSGQKFIAHCAEGEKFWLKDEARLKGEYTVLVGPEGDFAMNEINLALKSGFIPVTLGNSRLRTETAALEACFEINFINR